MVYHFMLFPSQKVAFITANSAFSAEGKGGGKIISSKKPNKTSFCPKTGEINGHS